MVIVCRSNLVVLLSAVLFSILSISPAGALDRAEFGYSGGQGEISDEMNSTGLRHGGVDLLPVRVMPSLAPLKDLLVKVAYGRTFGTCTALDYATLELSKSVTRYPLATSFGACLSELQVALLASYVFYSEGTVERLKRLDFRDGYELAWLPKGRISLPGGLLGFVPYCESGAGISYVSETYRNSGSRFNWSLLGGLGLEKRMASLMVLSVGLQWRHLSNGNMWGKGDELHNSNSGTDMIQGLATLVHRF